MITPTLGANEFLKITDSLQRRNNGALLFLNLRGRVFNKSQRGFTLLELIVVLTLMVIAAGILIPSIASNGNSEFNAQVRKAAAVLKYARRVAIVEATPQTVRLFALDRSAGDFTQQKQLRLTERQTTDWVSEDIRLDYQSELSQPSSPAQHIDVVYFPQGGSTGGVLSFTQGERHAQIRVDPITGRIAAAYNGETLDEEALNAAF